MPKKIALEELSPTAQRLHDAQFQALIAAQESDPNPPVDLASDTLKTRRLALGLRSTTVASHLQIAESSLRNYENGTQEPGLKIHLWQQLMALYRVNTQELFQLIANTKAMPAAPSQEPAASAK